MIWEAFYVAAIVLFVANIAVLVRTNNGKLKWALIFLFFSLVLAAALRVLLPMFTRSQGLMNIIVVSPVIMAMCNTTYVFFTYTKKKE